MIVELVKYDLACRALAEARSLDEAKKIHDVAAAMAAYARQAKNLEMEADAKEIRMRAIRRIDQMRLLQKQTIGLATGTAGTGRPSLGGLKINPPKCETPSLSSQGIDKNLAHQARLLGALSDAQFEHAVAMARAAVIDVTKVLNGDDKAERRALREAELGKRQRALPQKKYGLIYADPEWRFEPWSRLTGMDRSADNHYPTSATEVIAARPVESIAADDSALGLWATVPMLPQALLVMGAWGFDYKTHWAWGKDRIGPGYWNRNKHELFLFGTRGNVPCPAPGDQWDSLLTSPRRSHSEKPDLFLEMMEAYFPSLPKIELNRRGAARPGWDAWGNEAEPQAEARVAALC